MKRPLAVLLSCSLFVVIAVAAIGAPQSRAPRYVDLPGRTDELPYSHLVVVGNTVYLSGTIGTDPDTGQAHEDIFEVHMPSGQRGQLQPVSGQMLQERRYRNVGLGHGEEESLGLTDRRAHRGNLLESIRLNLDITVGLDSEFDDVLSAHLGDQLAR